MNQAAEPSGRNSSANSGATGRTYKYYDWLMALFVTVLLVSNILSSAKLIDLGIQIGGTPLIFDAGTLVFPISYIFGDILTEVYGYQRSRRVIWAGFFAAALMAFFVWLAGMLPGAADWRADANFGPEVVPGQVAYDALLGGISGLIIASLIAYFMGEFANSYVIARMKVATKGRWLPLRTITSTLAGQGVDTLAFYSVATLLGVFPPELFISLIITNYLLKVGIEVVLTPVTVPVVKALKRAEDEDHYDYNTSFNPFRLDV